MRHSVAMKIWVTLSDDLVRRIDRLVGPQRRGASVAKAVERALENEQRWTFIGSALTMIDEGGPERDTDVGRWVPDQRRGAR